MTAAKSTPTTSGDFICLYPIGGMTGYGNGPDIVSMGGVRFARAQIVSRDWRSIGFAEDPIAALNGPIKTVDDCDVLAVVTLADADGDPNEAAAKLAEKALRHLLSCNPGWTRSRKRRLVVPGASTVRLLGFQYAQKLPPETAGRPTWTSTGPTHEIRLDGFWWDNSKDGFYSELDGLLSRGHSSWEKRLVSASELLGAARLAVTPWESFFHSMVGIEYLLKRSGKWREQVPPALKTLFGWLTVELGEWYAQELENLYGLRNGLVHEGRALEIEQRHAELADEVLYNCLSLALKHPHVKSLEGLLKEATLLTEQKCSGLEPTALLNAAVFYD